MGRVCLPIIDSFIQAEQYHIEVFEYTSLFDLVSKEKGSGVEECSERRVEHEFILCRRTQDVENEIEGVSVHC